MIYSNSQTHFGQWLLDPLPGWWLAWDCFDYKKKKQNTWNSLLEQNIIKHTLVIYKNTHDTFLFSELDALTAEMEKQFWKIKAPACFLSRPRTQANANNSVVDKLK